MAHQNLSSLFEQVVSSSFSTLTSRELLDIALAIWYENYLPSISHLNSLQQRKAGYLIDRLMRYNCVDKSRKLELLKLVNTLKSNSYSPDNLVNTDAEPLAVTWGLNEDISELMPDLLMYQTRHYLKSAS